MELVIGKRLIELEFGDNKDIVSWVFSKLKNREIVLSLIDLSIVEFLKEEVIKVFKIVILCILRVFEFRLIMRSVV